MSLFHSKKEDDLFVEQQALAKKLINAPQIDHNLIMQTKRADSLEALNRQLVDYLDKALHVIDCSKDSEEQVLFDADQAWRLVNDLDNNYRSIDERKRIEEINKKGFR